MIMEIRLDLRKEDGVNFNYYEDEIKKGVLDITACLDDWHMCFLKKELNR